MGSNPLRILVADDDAELRALLCEFLTSEGHEVLLARDGEEAVRRAVAESPDLVLMDVAMPRLDGFAAYRWMMRDPSLAGTPVVLLTATLPDGGACRSVAAGGIDLLPKPCDLQELAARIRLRTQGRDRGVPVGSRRTGFQWAVDTDEVPVEE